MFEVAPPVPLDANQRKRLEFLVRAGNTPQKLVQRARIVLLDGHRKLAAAPRHHGLDRGPSLSLCPREPPRSMPAPKPKPPRDAAAPD